MLSQNPGTVGMEIWLVDVASPKYGNDRVSPLPSQVIRKLLYKHQLANIDEGSQLAHSLIKYLMHWTGFKLTTHLVYYSGYTPTIPRN